MRRDGGGGPDDVAGNGRVVALGRRSRRGAPADLSAPNPGHAAAIALLTPEERTALNLTASDDQLPLSGPSLLVAARALAMLAVAHFRRRLVDDDDAPELTRRDRISLALIPRVGLDVERRMTRDEGPGNGYDPILALLEGSRDDEPSHLVVGARLDLGTRGTDGADEL